MLATHRRTQYDDSYPTCELTFAELRVYTADSDPAVVSEILGLEGAIQRRGQRKANSLGRERTIRLNGWFLSSEGMVASRDLRQHLDWLLERLVPRTAQLKEVQRMPGLKMGINCIWWSARGQGGPTLWPEQMGRIAALDLECSFDISFFGDDDE